MTRQSVPTVEEARVLLGLNSDALSEGDFITFYGLAQNEVDNTTDYSALMYYTLWLIADRASWEHVTRLGNTNFSAPDPEVWRKRYVNRCKDLGVSPRGVAATRLRKVNSDLDDYPEEHNP